MAMPSGSAARTPSGLTPTGVEHYYIGTDTRHEQQVDAMKLRRLCKSEESHVEGKCPAMYVADDPAVMVCQGTHLDAETSAELLDVASNEGGLAVPTETVLRAAALVLAEHGPPRHDCRSGRVPRRAGCGGPMSRWIRQGQDAEWAALFTGYQKSAHRLEAQQIYDSDSEREDVRRFVAGEPSILDLSWSIPKIRAQIAAGRTHSTVRVVVEPPTDYTRWELSIYPTFAKAGEDIRIIPIGESDDWPDGVPRHDYWLFDDRDVWWMHYDDQNGWAGAELLDDPAAIADHLQWRDTTIARSVPLAEYLAARTP